MLKPKIIVNYTNGMCSIFGDHLSHRRRPMGAAIRKTNYPIQYDELAKNEDSRAKSIRFKS